MSRYPVLLGLANRDQVFGTQPRPWRDPARRLITVVQSVEMVPPTGIEPTLSTPIHDGLRPRR